MNFFATEKSIGILGGGQLGKMLLIECARLDINCAILDPSEKAPARPYCTDFTKGDFSDYETVLAFGKNKDLLTIEIEHVNTEALTMLATQGKMVYPYPRTISLIQNKCSQKDFFNKIGLPTAPYVNFNSITDLKKSVKSNQLSLPFIWKTAKFGYDGRGVQKITTINQLNNLTDGACLTEKIIDLNKELSVIVSRNSIGEIAAYPVVEMLFDETVNQLSYVLCPARINAKIAQEATAMAKYIAHKLDHVGLLAVELFLDKEGKIMINELAPRPHNSGHLTIEACMTNQFEQHLRAILNLSLGSPKLISSAVMLNLTGAIGHKGSVYYQNIDTLFKKKGVYTHIYGKRETRPHRKMGHITVIDDDVAYAFETAQKIKQSINVIGAS